MDAWIQFRNQQHCSAFTEIESIFISVIWYLCDVALVVYTWSDLIDFNVCFFDEMKSERNVETTTNHTNHTRPNWIGTRTYHHLAEMAEKLRSYSVSTRFFFFTSASLTYFPFYCLYVVEISKSDVTMWLWHRIMFHKKWTVISVTFWYASTHKKSTSIWFEFLGDVVSNTKFRV